MYYESEQEINNLLQELDFDMLDIDDIYTPTDEEIKAIDEFYDVLE